MMRWIALPLVLVFAATLPAQEELPQDPEQPMDIEPPLLIQESPNQNIVYTSPGTAEQKPAPNVDELTASVEKARKSAVSGERLYKAGIIAKVEAENRALKVIRLEAGEISQSDAEAARSAELAATKEAELAIAKKDKAELDAAVLNLQRQKKLLAMGSGRKSEVNRAQEKVSALQQKN